MRNYKFLLALIGILTLLVIPSPSSAQMKSRAVINQEQAAARQPLYTEYKGVRLGMTATEVRSKLGEPTYSDKELDLLTLSPTETAQIAYDSTGRVKVISVDYQNGAGAPGPLGVVGVALETRDDGPLYKQVRYDTLKFWVSYSRTAGPAYIVTVTIQKM